MNEETLFTICTSPAAMKGPARAHAMQNLTYLVHSANAYPKLVAALRGVIDCARARNVKLDKAAECDAIASTILQALGE